MMKLAKHTVKKLLKEANQPSIIPGVGKGDDYVSLAIMSSEFMEFNVPLVMVFANMIGLAMGQKAREMKNMGVPDDMITKQLKAELDEDRCMREMLMDILYAGYVVGKKEAELAATSQ